MPSVSWAQRSTAVISPRSPVAAPSSVAWLNHDAAAKAGIYGNDAVEGMYPP